MHNSGIYRAIVNNNLRRALSFINRDPASYAKGYADRLYWGWKVSDFSNATLQGLTHTIAASNKLGLLSENFTLDSVDILIKAVDKIRRSNGSVEEAYPNESSFCVTALVCFDILRAIEILGDKLGKDQLQLYLSILEPLIEFIVRENEEHAIISNHLATAVGALYLWQKYTGDHKKRADELLAMIFQYQSSEGWYKEYEGADPGYQTLAVYYLYHAYRLTGNSELLASLERSGNFLTYFVHPDGTIGGLYGSRNTEVFYPGGIVGLSRKLPVYKKLLNGLEKGLSNGRHILPDAIDSGNFSPLLNSYSSAALDDLELTQGGISLDLPFKYPSEKKFDDAGLFIKSTNRYYAIINYKKGGTLKIFDKDTGLLDCEDGGVAGTLLNGDLFSTQYHNELIQFEDYRIETGFCKISQENPNPLRFIVLRGLSLTIFRSTYLGNLFKKFIVWLLMTGKKKIDGMCLRVFKFTDDSVLVTEEIRAPKKTQNLGHPGKFRGIHMASSGYFSTSEIEKPVKSKIVRYL